MPFTVEPMRAQHWPAVAAIYQAGIASGNATFESAVPTWETWDTSHRLDLRLVAVSEGDVVGWAAASSVSDRCCYSGVVETSVYVKPGRQREGVGRSLLQALILAAEAAGIWTMQAGIFPENEASIALHERCGFRVVGRRERIGQLQGVWRDVMLLERRSQTVSEDGDSAHPSSIDAQALVDSATHPLLSLP